MFVIGFLSYFLISIPVIIGYEIVRRLCNRIKNNEETKDLEDKIIAKSYIVKAFEKITAMTLCAIFLFELDKYKKMYQKGYIATNGIDIPLSGSYTQNEIYKKLLGLVNDC